MLARKQRARARAEKAKAVAKAHGLEGGVARDVAGDKVVECLSLLSLRVVDHLPRRILLCAGVSVLVLRGMPRMRMRRRKVTVMPRWKLSAQSQALRRMVSTRPLSQKWRLV